MAQREQFDILVLGSGKSGKFLAWHLAQSGRRTAVVERQWIGGSCPNVACLPSKNEIWSARVAHLARHAAQFGVVTGPVTTDMARVRQRKRDMVEREIDLHLQTYKASGAELIMGSGRFVAPKTLEVRLNDGGTRVLAGDQVFLNVGTHAAIPDIPGLEAARPLTHVEALELDYLPAHLIVLGGGYVGLELAQAYRRFGSRVTVIEHGPQLMSREDPDVADEMQRILTEEGIQFLLSAKTLDVHGRSGEEVSVTVRTSSGEQKIDGSDSWSRRDAFRTPPGSGSRRPGSCWMLAATFASTSGWRPPRPTCGPWVTAPAARNSLMSPATTSGSSGTTWPEESAARAIGSCPTACLPIRRSRTWD